jgi:hypothetical protein
MMLHTVFGGIGVTIGLVVIAGYAGAVVGTGIGVAIGCVVIAGALGAVVVVTQVAIAIGAGVVTVVAGVVVLGMVPNMGRGGTVF